MTTVSFRSPMVADGRRDGGRDHEHDVHRVRELLDEQPPGGLVAALQ